MVDVSREEALILAMNADIKRIEKALNQARGTTNRQLKGIEDRFDRMNSHVKRSGDSMARDLRASIAAIGIGAAISQVTDYADTWTTARNKLAAAGVEQGKLATTMQSLVALSKETGSSFDATADLYAKVQRNADKLGLSQEEVLKITEQVNKAFVAGGAAAGEQASGILQLGQALSSGTLAGDELKALRENAPLLAQAIADEFGVTIGELKKLGAEGALASDKVAKAILNAKTIQDQFGRTTRTVAQAMENLRTEFTRYIAESRVAQTLVQSLSGFLQFATDNMNTFADAAIVAASVIGGTLAAGAIVRLVASLGTMIRTAREAATAMQALRIAATFFTGPIGAAILGIGAALATLALSAGDTGDATERATRSLEELGKLQTSNASITAQLEAAQRRLTEAIREGGAEAQIASTKEVERLRRLLEANKALFEVEKTRARVALNQKSADYRNKYVEIPGLQNTRGFGRSTLESLDFNVLAPALRARRQSIDDFALDMSQKARVRNLTEEETVLLNITQAILNYRKEVGDLTKQLQEFEAVSKVSIGGEVLPFPSAPDGKSSGGSAAAKGFRTDLEKFNETLKELGKEAANEGELIQQAVMAVDSLQQNGDRTASDFVAKLKDANEQLTALESGAGEQAFERSRRALQALLDLANSDLPAAFAALPSLGDILTRDDQGLAKTKLGELAKAATDAILAGTDKLAADAEAQIIAIEKARAAAIAAGESDLSRFDRAAQTVLRNFEEGLNEALDVPYPFKTEDLLKDLPDLPEFVDMYEGLRDSVRDAMRDGIRQGIETDNWGDALRSILAAIITNAFEGSINQFADALTDIITGQNSGANALFSAIASAIGFGGPRAMGGPVSGGRSYLVGENGPELVRMGGNGHVLNAAMTRDLMAGVGGGGATINAPLIVQGSIDAVTWPRVQAAMRAQAQQIMAAVPTAVDGKLIYNRRQKRRI